MRELLHIKARREKRLRQVLVGVIRQERQIEAAQQNGYACWEKLGQARYTLLEWRGVTTVGDMQRQQQEMQGVLQGFYALSAELRRLRQERETQQVRRRVLQQERVTLMRKQEKLKLVLADEY